MTTVQPVRYEFECFVFLADTMSLRRNGYAVRLSEQTSRVLLEFMQHPGELVSRKQLFRVLWPDGAFSESEQGLNNIISKLRTTLRDDPKTPKYIDTIPKRGYQFLARVQVIHDHPHRTHITASEESLLQAGPAVVELQSPPQGEEIYVLPGEPDLQSQPVSAEASTSKSKLWGELREPASVSPDERKSGHRWRRRLAISALVAFTAIAPIAIWHRRQRAVPTQLAEVYLAVAPFDLEGAEPAQEPLSESFRLDLIDGLSMLPGMHVRAAHSVTTGKLDPAGRTTSQNLDVNAILYTQLTQTGKAYNLRVELVRDTDSTHLQSWHYSGAAAQLGSIRQQIEADVFSYWKGTGVAKQAEVGGTADPIAYELYLRARYHAQQRDPNSMPEAQKEYQAAIDRDPAFAKAYSGLALAKFISSKAKIDEDEAESLAAKAIALSPNLADVHAVLGNIYSTYEWRFNEGERELRRAVALDSGAASYRVWLAFALGNRGRFQEAFAQIDIAKANDPYWPQIYQNEVVLGISSHQPERMISASDMLIKIRPDFANSYDTRAKVNWNLGHDEKAIADWRHVGVMEGDSARIALEDRGLEVFRKYGRKAYAQLRLKSILKHPEGEQAVDSFIAAEWYAYAGDKEGCMEELTRLINARDEDAIDLLVNPAYVPLHHDARFERLLERVGVATH